MNNFFLKFLFFLAILLFVLANIVINHVLIMGEKTANIAILLFYKIFNVVENKYFNPKTVVVRIFYIPLR